MGLAAAWALARAGREPLVLEQFRVGHPHGSSHGATRIFRLAYVEAEWVRLAQEAFVALARTRGGVRREAARPDRPRRPAGRRRPAHRHAGRLRRRVRALGRRGGRAPLRPDDRDFAGGVSARGRHRAGRPRSSALPRRGHRARGDARRRAGAGHRRCARRDRARNDRRERRRRRRRGVGEAAARRARASTFPSSSPGRRSRTSGSPRSAPFRP